MGISAPWAEPIYIIALNPVKKWLGINLMALSAPSYNYIDIIALKTSKTISMDQPNAP